MTEQEKEDLDALGDFCDFAEAVGAAGENVPSTPGRAFDAIEFAASLGGKDIDAIMVAISDIPGREVAGIIGGFIGGAIGGVIGGTIGSSIPVVGTVVGAAGGAYVGDMAGEAIGEAIYDQATTPPSPPLTDAQKAELATMLTAGGMPWDYNPNGENSGFDVGDLLNDLGKELGKLLAQLPDAFNPQDFIDGILDGLQAALPGGLIPWLLDLFPYELDPDIYQPFLDALGWHRPRDPIVLDLDGDGIETISVSSNTHALFDHNNDSIRTATGWVRSDDGLLVLDRNGNGTIDNGSELFGDQTIVNGTKATGGFNALSSEDTNRDGKFDANDTNFSNVRVWRDMDGDVLLFVA